MIVGLEQYSQRLDAGLAVARQVIGCAYPDFFLVHVQAGAIRVDDLESAAELYAIRLAFSFFLCKFNIVGCRCLWCCVFLLHCGGGADGLVVII